MVWVKTWEHVARVGFLWPQPRVGVLAAAQMRKHERKSAARGPIAQLLGSVPVVVVAPPIYGPWDHRVVTLEYRLIQFVEVAVSDTRRLILIDDALRPVLLDQIRHGRGVLEADSKVHALIAQEDSNDRFVGDVTLKLGESLPPVVLPVRPCRPSHRPPH